MAVDWSDAENDVIVDVYLRMLKEELLERKYVKRRYNEEARARIGRSHASVEFKLQNVSAVLREMNFPFISGYKPYVNFQASLREAVIKGLEQTAEIFDVALKAVTRPVADGLAVDFHWNMVDPPVVEFSSDHARLRRANRIDFARLEDANRRLGFAGELLVLHRERQSLRRLGAQDLAGQVEHVSATRGDGLGYDILSFQPSGEPKYIEVKTTRLGAYWPIIVSRNEVQFSSETAENFHLYRVFGLDEARSRAGLFTVQGPIAEGWNLEASAYRALPKSAGV